MAAYRPSHCTGSLAWLRCEMVTLKVQRWPIPDYFMAYFLQHPEGNANIIGLLIQANWRQQEQQHCPLLLFSDTAPASPRTPLPYLKPTKEPSNQSSYPYIYPHTCCHIYVLFEYLLLFFDFFFCICFSIKQVSLPMNHKFQCLA